MAPPTKSSERILVFHRAVTTSVATKLSTFVLCVVCMCAGVCVLSYNDRGQEMSYSWLSVLFTQKHGQITFFLNLMLNLNYSHSGNHRVTCGRALQHGCPTLETTDSWHLTLIQLVPTCFAFSFDFRYTMTR